MTSPIFLLLLVGGLGGVNFLLGKLAAEAGIAPVLWALVISAGAAASIAALRPRCLSLPRGHQIRYVAISGLVSFALANILVYELIPRLGAGYVGLMFALSPVATLALSVLAGTGRPGPLGLAGIAVAFAGAGAIVVSGGETSALPALGLLLLGLAIPLVLAAGNVYRTLDWPEGAAPDSLAVWSHLVAALVFIAVFAARGGVPLGQLSLAPGLVALQVAVAGLTFPAYFRLQRDGGPVLLSQIGYVSAAVGLVGANLILGERYAPLAWAGAGAIALGIALTVTERRRADRAAETLDAKPRAC
ncbi:MAG: DMT family transporter [Paracoccaceae bacterium]|nr:DMT family transporter [Paracoccaceae bacterium]